MRALLDIREIFDRHANRYVLLGSCKFDPDGRVTHGDVIDASPDPDPVYARLQDHPNSVIVFAGPEDEELEGAFLDSGQTWNRVQ